ncbi:MAG: amidohydrolase [Dethiobacter sp.]|nr:amidohydrolase [Dethiobacter sp.]
MNFADLVLKDGKVMSSDKRFMEAVAICGETINLVGETKDVSRLIGPQTKVIDLAGRVVLPGFIDAHTHFIQTGLKQNFFIDLADMPNRKSALERLAQAVSERGNDAWIIGSGWDESHWPDQEYLTRKELDQVGPNNPIVAIRIDGHLVSVNTKALDRVHLQGPKEELDLTRGILRESVAWFLLQSIQIDLSILTKAVADACRIAASYGVTSIHDQDVRLHSLKAYEEAKQRGLLTVRVSVYASSEQLDDVINKELKKCFNGNLLRLGGIGEIYSDGSIGAMNAAFTEPYRDSSGIGKLNMTKDELANLLKRAECAGLQTALHAIGDRAVEMSLATHALAETSPHFRHRIEHLELSNRKDHAKMAEMGLTASMQPNFAQWSGPGKMYEQRLGQDRDQRTNPLKLIIEAGLPLAFGSDCMPFSPLYGIHWAVNPPHPDQKLSVTEAIDSYTRQGAYLTFEEEIKGEIVSGKLADLIVLNRDPFLYPKEISEIAVDLTLLGGRIVHQRNVKNISVI